MIIQGTTPTHTYRLPFDTSLVKVARFVYSQNDEVKVVKQGEAVTMAGSKVTTTLTQEDTFSFTPGVPVTLVLRVLTRGDDALVTNERTLLVRGCDDKEVLA